MRISIRYSEIVKQVLALVIIPIVYIGGFVFFAIYLDKIIVSETVMDIIILGGSFLMIGLGALTVLKVIIVDAEMEYDIHGIHIYFKRKSFLFLQHDFFTNYSNIKNASIDEDSAGRTFATVKLRSPKKSIVILPDKAANTDNFVTFWNDLEQQISSFNMSNKDQPEFLIEKVGFYESGFMKFVAYFSGALAILLVIVKIAIPDSIPTWKLIAFCCYALPLVLTVFISNKKSIKK